jgi:hypothetical protein
MQRLTFLAWLLCCVAFYPALSQNRQLSFESAQKSIVISDSRVDPAGNVISVGYQYDPKVGQSFADAIAIKTSRSGKRIWVRQLSFYSGSSAKASYVQIAANGDYLIGGCLSSQPMIWRLSPSGTNVFARYYSSYYSGGGSRNETVSLAELPNGHIALCNNFFFVNSSYNDQGVLIHLDSAGWAFTLAGNAYGYDMHTYGAAGGSLGSATTEINEVVSFGKHLYFVGGHKEKFYTGGIVIRTDTNGNNPTFYLATGLQTRGITSPMEKFTGATVKDGRLYLAGSYYDTLSRSTGYLIGRFDTLSKTLTGMEILEPGRELWNPQFEIADTAAWYYAVQPHRVNTTYNFYDNTIFTGKFSNGTLVQNRKIYVDSAILLSAITVIGDTVICSGTSRMGRGNAGFFCSYNMAAAASTLCNVSDTLIQASACSLSLFVHSLPDGARLQSASYTNSVLSPCIYEVQRCGAPCSSSRLSVSIKSLSPTDICPGDTLRLVKTAPCMRTTWYRDSVKLGLSDTLTVIADSAALANGRYYLIADDGACSDTSNTITVRLFPVPSIEQRSDTLWSSPGVSYQWIDSLGLPISGATGAFLPNLTAYGNYFVEVTDSNGCTRRSPAYFYRGNVGVVANASRRGRISVYPNPTSSTFSLRNVPGTISQLYLTDLKGRKVAYWEQPGPIVSLAGYSLAPGIYVLTVIGQGFMEHLRLGVNMP